MDPDRSHMSLTMPTTMSSGPSTQQQQQPQPTQPVHQQSNSDGHATDGRDNSPTPTKRGPGRPKGSTKKSQDSDPASPPKIKRPVGRPRKDGRPAGSVPKIPRGPGRPRKNFPPDFAVNTFPQQSQNQGQQSNGDQQQPQWTSGMFNNYRLSKDGASDPTASGSGERASGGDKLNGTSTTDANAQQNSKWFPPNASASTSSAPGASSSSIANALIHPPSMSAAGVNSLTDTLVSNSALMNMAGGMNGMSGMRGFGDGASMSPAEIPDFVMSTIYTLFSRPPSRNGLLFPKEVISTYRGHINLLSGSHSVAYNALKTFWLPHSPLLFRLVLPRQAPASRSNQRNPSGSHPSPSPMNANFPTQSNHPSLNGDNQSNRTPTAAEQNYDPHRFFYWDPFHLSLSGPINCPACRQGPLTHLGPIRTGPLRVFDLPSSSAPTANAHVLAGLVPAVFYVIGMQYGCSRGPCGMRFNSWDSQIVNNLPQVLADEWPVHLPSISNDSERTDSKGTKWSGDAISRSLYTLAKSLLQVGTPQQIVRDILARLWNCEGEREEDHEEDEEETPPEAIDPPSGPKVDKDKAATAEALYTSPYLRLWPAQSNQSSEMEPSSSASITNGQPPTKRQKTDAGSSIPTVVSATAPSYLSRSYGSSNTLSGDPGPSGVSLQVSPPSEQRTNGAGIDNRSPRIQPHSQSHPQSHPPQSQSQSQAQPQQSKSSQQSQSQSQSHSQPQPQPPSQAQPQVRHQPSQSQLNPNPSGRPLPSPRTSFTHNHAQHIHTPSPIYPPASLPNSNTNSPQTGNGAHLSLKRPLEADTHHHNPSSSSRVPSVPAPTSTQTSPAQPHFPGIGHNSPYTQLRPVQQHSTHPSQQPPLPPHHQPPSSTRPAPPLIHHPSLGLPNPIARYPQSGLQSHQSLLSTGSHSTHPAHPAHSGHPGHPSHHSVHSSGLPAPSHPSAHQSGHSSTHPPTHPTHPSSHSSAHNSTHPTHASAHASTHPSAHNSAHPSTHSSTHHSTHPHPSAHAPRPQAAQPRPPAPVPAPRRVRHCVKCGQHECKGKGGSQFCKNPCKDCGDLLCKGRNSKRPNATCREGW